MNEDSAVATTAVSIVVQQKQQELRIAVSAMVPRKRTSVQDPIQWTLQHYLFWDHSTCTHLDALLTRLAPLSVVHLGCTERAEVRRRRRV